jgi:16S rRNA (adenine1518-N6/adenine1519-N6)-dimethyltransferase
LKDLPDFDSPVAINAVLAERGLSPQKRFGQNFLIRRRAREKIVAALSLPPNAFVWEIGAGMGAMTAMLLDQRVRVTAFEIDRGFCALLTDIFSARKNFSLVEGDALETWKGEGRADFLLGNLPYNVAARIIGGFIENGVFFKRMAVTVQREMARRISAKPGSSDYSSFSVLCSSVYKARSIASLKRDCFYPVPNVDSEALCLELKTPPKMCSSFFYRMVRALFSERRKMIKNNLLRFAKKEAASACPMTDAFCARLLQTAGISPTERAENLSCEDFSRLAGILEDAFSHENRLHNAGDSM